MPRLRAGLRWLLAVAMVAIGVSHFVLTDQFAAMVPAILPAHRALVYASGAFEILGGLGLLFERSRPVAAWGLILLYIAVFPANVHMALHAEQFAPTPPIALWLRLPFQALFIAWAWWFTRAPSDQRSQTP